MVETYGTEVWWQGLSRPTATGAVRSPTSFNCDLINKVIIKSLRAALPEWRKAQNVVLHREGGVSPAHIPLGGYRLQLVARLNYLDDRHPLRIRASIYPDVGTLKFKREPRLSKKPEARISRVQRAYRRLPRAEAAEPLPAPIYTRTLGNKANSVANYELWLSSIASSDICAYSDTS